MASWPEASTLIRISPPGGVCFTALSTRLSSTCSSRTGSPTTTKGTPWIRMSWSVPLPAPCIVARHRSATVRRSTGTGLSAIFPEVSRATSTRALTSLVKCLSCRPMTAWIGASASGGSLPDCRRATALATAPSGLRSSWPSIARNSSFFRLASWTAAYARPLETAWPTRWLTVRAIAMCAGWYAPEVHANVIAPIGLPRNVSGTQIEDVRASLLSASTWSGRGASASSPGSAIRARNCGDSVRRTRNGPDGASGHGGYRPPRLGSCDGSDANRCSDPSSSRRSTAHQLAMAGTMWRPSSTREAL